MTSGIGGADKRVTESRYAGRIRETSLDREHAGRQRHLAELEELIRRQKSRSAAREDTVELHVREEDTPQTRRVRPERTPPEDRERKADDEGPHHLDVTV